MQPKEKESAKEEPRKDIEIADLPIEGDLAEDVKGGPIYIKVDGRAGPGGT